MKKQNKQNKQNYKRVTLSFNMDDPDAIAAYEELHKAGRKKTQKVIELIMRPQAPTPTETVPMATAVTTSAVLTAQEDQQEFARVGKKTAREDEETNTLHLIRQESAREMPTTTTVDEAQGVDNDAQAGLLAGLAAFLGG